MRVLLRLAAQVLDASKDEPFADQGRCQTGRRGCAKPSRLRPSSRGVLLAAALCAAVLFLQLVTTAGRAEGVATIPSWSCQPCHVATSWWGAAQAPNPACGETASPDKAVSVSDLEEESAWNPPMGHFFFRLGGDGLMGLYADVGHGISGYWGQRALLGETFFIANLEFLNTVLADVFGGSIGIPGVTSFSKTGQSVGAGVRLRAFADFTKERGAHGFGLGLGAVGLFTESPLGAPFVVLGHLTGSASWPFVEVNLYATLAIWASAPDARRALQNGSFGVNLGLRDPLAPLFELLGRLSK